MTDPQLRALGLRYLQRVENIYKPLLASNPDDLSDAAHAAIAIVGLGYLIAGLDEDDTGEPPAISD